MSEDLRADQARRLLRRYGAVLIAAMVVTLIGVGGYEWWEQQQTVLTDSVAMKFLTAQKDAKSKTPPKDLPAVFSELAKTGPGGYRVLARLQLAAAEWEQNRHDAAVADWKSISDDPTAPQILRELATLLSVQHQMDNGDAKVLKAELSPLVSGASHWRPMAEQTTALLDIRLGRVVEAKKIMQALTADPQAPTAVRQMAQDLLITLDEDGAGPHG